MIDSSLEVQVGPEANVCDLREASHQRLGDYPEYAQARLLSNARTALADALFAEPEALHAGGRVVELCVHYRRVSLRALLVERPAPPWIEDHLQRLHDEAGCWRSSFPTSTRLKPNLADAMARVPWSGEWLVRVWSTLPASGLARIGPVSKAWLNCRNAFVEDRRGLVAFIARRYLGRCGISRDDLVQEGLVALCRAVERYDPERGARFSSYAVPVIRHAMVQYVRRMGPAPTPPRFGVPIMAAAFIPADSTPNGARKHQWLAPLSLDAPLEDGDSLGERLADFDALPPDLSASRALERERLRAALSALPAESREIITLHWGLDGSSARSVHAIAQELGRTPAEVRTVIEDALAHLRRRVTATFKAAR
jgi:RNA polymerase sigma factor (sigma-70 family)